MVLRLLKLERVSTVDLKALGLRALSHLERRRTRLYPIGLLLSYIGLQFLILLAIDWLAIWIQILRKEGSLALLGQVVWDVTHSIHSHFWSVHLIWMDKQRC